MALLAVAFPEFSEPDYAKIQLCRKHSDALYYNLIEPHFTFVFPANDISPQMFIEEVEYHCKDVNAIPFIIRCATVNKNAFNDFFHTFLVPEEGYSKIVKLHDQLYSGIFQKHLRIDIDFIPHIGVASSKLPAVCHTLATEWNMEELEIPGMIRRISVIEHLNNSIKMLHHIVLR